MTGDLRGLSMRIWQIDIRSSTELRGHIHVLAALRYRRGQALILALLSAVVTACAVLMPLGLSSLQESLVKGRFDALVPVDRTLQVTTATQPQASDVRFGQLDGAIPGSLRTVLDSPVHWSVVFKVSIDQAQGQALAVDGACSHLRLDSGRCPSGADQMLVTPALLRSMGARLGDQVEVGFSSGVDATTSARRTIVGTYTQPAGDPFWGGRILARSALPHKADTEVADTLIVPAAGLDALTGKVSVTRTSVWPIVGSALHPDNLPSVAAAAQSLLAPLTSLGAQVSSPFPTMLQDVHADLDQARTILPVLLAQLAVLLLVVLALVSSAAVEQRGRELALARLRGRGAGAARKLLIGELGLAMLAGIPLGVALAYAVDWFARVAWLMPGISAYVGWPVLLAALVAGAIILAVLLVTTRPVARADVAGLLRGSPATRGGRFARVIDIMVITAAGVAVAAMATGALTGPVALIAPSLLALAVGLALSMMLVPLAARWGVRALLRGRASTSLAMLGAARRPAIRRIVAVITVAAALAVFSANAYAVGQRNRAQRAGVEVGAAMAVFPDQSEVSGDWRAIQAAVKAIDPAQRTTTALLEVSSGGSSGVSVLAGDVSAYRRVMDGGPHPPDLSALDAAGARPVTLTGTSLTATVTTEQLEASVQFYDMKNGASWVPDGADLQRTPDRYADVPNGTRSLLHIVPPHLELTLVRPDGVQAVLDMGAVAPTKGGSATLQTPVPCASGCTVAGLALGHSNSGDAEANTVHNPERRDFSGGLPLRGTFDVAWTGAPDSGLGDATLWTATKIADDQSMSASPAERGLRLNWHYTGQPVVMQTRASGAAPDVVVSDAVWNHRSSIGAVSGSTVQVPSTSGLQDRQASIVAHAPYLPGMSGNVVFMPLSAATAPGVRIDGFQVRPVILTSDASPAHERAIRGALSGQGLEVLSVERASDLQRVYDRSASAWGLQFAIAVSIASILIAVLVMVLVMVMSWRERARDLAGLRLAGTPGRTIRAAAVLEQTIVVLAATIVGAVCGLVGAWLVMKRVPLFANPPTIDVVDLRPAIPTVLVTLTATVAVFLLVGVLLGRWLASRARLGRAQA